MISPAIEDRRVSVAPGTAVLDAARRPQIPPYCRIR